MRTNPRKPNENEHEEAQRWEEASANGVLAEYLTTKWKMWAEIAREEYRAREKAEEN